MACSLLEYKSSNLGFFDTSYNNGDYYVIQQFKKISLYCRQWAFSSFFFCNNCIFFHIFCNIAHDASL